MAQEFQRFTKRYVNVLGVFIGVAVVSSILLYAGCGMAGSPNIPTPTPTPAPTPTPDNVRPTSVITSPTAGEIVSTGATVNITGAASDAGGGSVVRVEVSVDGGATWNPAIGTNAWSYSWSPTLAGLTTIKSRALDTSGNQQDPPAEVTVTVQDATRPTSTITSPTEGATVLIGTPVAITGTASDAGGGLVVRVEVSVDGGATWNPAIGTNTWSFSWTPSAPGQAPIKSRAVDNIGNVQNPPAEIHVTVDAPPTSTITTPTEGATVLIGTPVAITGTASDPGGGLVVRVEVSVDGGVTWNPAVGTNAWSFNWTPSAPGQAPIKSRAVDNTGNQQDPPAEITVTVRVPITIRVPSDQPTIQAAINVATFGDTVLVAPGTYFENINFGRKAITVTSESGPQVTIIDGRNADPVVIFTSGEGRDSILNGFTLQNGRSGFNNQGFGEGGGITVQRSSPTITKNVIKNNQACHGGGIGIGFGSPLIQQNTITGNGNNACSGGDGGGISIRGAASAEILDNVISDNGMSSSDGGGISMFAAGTPSIKRNVIKGNSAGGQGGGIWMVNFSDALIIQNLIVGNQASVGGGLYWLVPSGPRGPILVNNTIADNNATSIGSGIFADGFDVRTELTNNIIVPKPGQTGLYCGDFNDRNQPIIRFNNIFSAGGMAYGGICADKTGMDGNISADPLFTNPAQGDYHLQQGSPSIDSGDNLTPNLPDKDVDGDPRILDGDGNGTAIVDMGVDEFLAPTSFNISIQDESRRGLRRRPHRAPSDRNSQYSNVLARRLQTDQLRRFWRNF